ncbi:MAG: MFS transporter [Patescibacteria group bacterium]|nr:MFS transporter [Patescibacteria group bacterium]
MNSIKTKKIIGLLLATLFMAVSLAQLAYIQSTFLNQYFTLEFVGIVFFISYLLTFFAINGYPNLIAKLGNLKTVIIAIVLEILSLAMFIYLPRPEWIFIGTIIYVIAINLIGINYDIFLEAYTANTKTGKIRGLYYTIYNLGWLASPFFTSLIFEKYGFNLIFGIIIFLSVIFLAILSFSFFNFKINYPKNYFNFRKTFAALGKNKDMQRIFFIALLLQIFYAIMVVYAPLYLSEYMGLSWTQIGIIFTVMLLPFVFLQYPAGYLADKYWGEKEMMTAGLVIMAIFSIAIFFIDTPTLWVWALILFLGRVGASLTEIMRDTYFFKKVDSTNIDMINAFRSTTPLAYLIAPIGASLTLYLLPFNYLFLILGLFLTSGLTVSLMIRDTK